MHFCRELANVAKYSFFCREKQLFWKHEVNNKGGLPNLGKLPVESLVRQKLCYPLKAIIYCFQILEMRKVPTQSIEKRGRETRETSRQGFSRDPRDREKEKGGQETSKILKKKKNEMGAGRRGLRNGGRKGEEILNILLGFVSKNTIRDAGSTAALYLHC